MPVADGSRTLFIRLSSLGDVILSEPTVRAYRQARPGAEVHFLTKGLYADAVRLFPGVDKVISTSRRRLSAAGLVRLIALLRKKGYDTVIDLQGSVRSRAVALALGAPERSICPKAALRRRLMPLGFFRCPGVDHAAKRYLTGLERLGIPSGGFDLRPRIAMREEAVRTARHLLREHGWRGQAPLVCVFAGARWPSKRWPPRHFSEVIRYLSARGGAWCALLGDENDRPVAREVMTNLSGEAADLTGRTGLAELAAVLSLAQLALTNDSGPMHLAAAVGTRVCAVFGPTVPALGFAPLGDGDRVFQVPLECRPCSIHGSGSCRRGDLMCLAAVRPEEIAREAIRALGEVAV